MALMRTSDCEILIVPGLTNSGPDHWQSRWEGKLSQFTDGVLEIETPEGEPVRVPLDQVGKANLKFEW